MDVRAARMMTLALAGVCGFLLLMALLQFAGFGRGYSWLPQLEPDNTQIAGNVERESFSLPPSPSPAGRNPLKSDLRGRI